MVTSITATTFNSISRVIERIYPYFLLEGHAKNTNLLA